MNRQNIRNYLIVLGVLAGLSALAWALPLAGTPWERAARTLHVVTALVGGFGLCALLVWVVWRYVRIYLLVSAALLVCLLAVWGLSHASDAFQQPFVILRNISAVVVLGPAAALFYVAALSLLVTAAMLLALAVPFTLMAIFVALVPVPKVPLRYNFRNLQVRWLTATITTLAVTLVVALLTVMLAFVKGMDALTEGSGNPGNVVILEEGTTDEVMSKLPNISVAELPDEVQGLVAKKTFKVDGKDVDEYLVSREVYAIVTQLIPQGSEGEYKKRFLQMRGLQKPHVSAYVHDIKLLGEKSRWFDGTGAKEIVLGHGIAKVMGEDQGKAILEPGDIVNLREENWTVVGVMAPSSTTFGSEIWTDDLIVQKYFGRESNYSSYVIRVTDPKMIKKVTEVMKDRAVVSFGVQAQSERDYYSNLSNTNLQFSFAIYLIAIVMAIGGLLGVMITMYAAVSQRSKDIGVLRLLGYRRWQVLCSFLLEALVIGVVGGILGVLLGSLAHGVEANSIVTGAGGGGKSIILKLTVDSGIILRGFVFSVAMGILGGIFPALSAMRLRPLESLR